MIKAIIEFLRDEFPEFLESIKRQLKAAKSGLENTTDQLIVLTRSLGCH